MNKGMLSLLSIYGAMMASDALHNTMPTFTLKSRVSPGIDLNNVFSQPTDSYHGYSKPLKHQIKRRKAAKMSKLSRKRNRR